MFDPLHQFLTCIRLITYYFYLSHSSRKRPHDQLSSSRDRLARCLRRNDGHGLMPIGHFFVALNVRSASSKLHVSSREPRSSWTSLLFPISLRWYFPNIFFFYLLLGSFSLGMSFHFPLVIFTFGIPCSPMGQLCPLVDINNQIKLN
jgi:hypothetical protein